jgi:hypothetical protein
MKFCTKTDDAATTGCGRIMTRNINSNQIEFKCFCGRTERGNPWDVRIAGDVLHAGDTEIMYQKLMKSAAHDPVNKKVMKQCPKCPLDYMTQIHVGSRKVVIWLCKCGYNSSEV